MSTFRVRRAIPSVLNTATTVRVAETKNITNSEAERVLTEFIDASDAISAGLAQSSQEIGLSKNNDSSAVLSQLKRIQRNLRGLPPLISESQGKPDSSANIEPPNKKIKFDDNEEDVAIEETVQPEEEDDDDVLEIGYEQEDEVEEEEAKQPEVVEEKKEKKHKKEKKDKKEKSKKEKKSKD
ncbi:hypothetical protein JA1_004317 [Spathaspora sp. JA1]|nr:hypothetical protein JA1_004317 [Spathaspora sp. JA1]